jgi:hypothetical protein
MNIQNLETFGTGLFGGAQPDRIKGLWSAVLLAQLRDAVLGGGTFGGPGAKRKADAWIRGGGADFRDVCDGAGCDPDVVRGMYVGGEIKPHHFNSTRSDNSAA